jgi:transposase
MSVDDTVSDQPRPSRTDRRLLRRAVLWRRRSFGCNSEAGCRFVERILTVVQTCRLHGKNTLEYLYHAVRNHRRGLSCPCLPS